MSRLVLALSCMFVRMTVLGRRVSWMCSALRQAKEARDASKKHALVGVELVLPGARVPTSGMFRFFRPNKGMLCFLLVHRQSLRLSRQAAQPWKSAIRPNTLCEGKAPSMEYRGCTSEQLQLNANSCHPTHHSWRREYGWAHVP